MRRENPASTRRLFFLLSVFVLLFFLPACFKLGGEPSIDAEFTLIREIALMGISEFAFSVDVKGVKDAAVVEFDNEMPSVTLSGGKAESRFFANIGTDEVTLSVRDSRGVELLKKTVALPETKSTFDMAAVEDRTGVYALIDGDLIFYSLECLENMTFAEKVELLIEVLSVNDSYVIIDTPPFGAWIWDFETYPANPKYDLTQDSLHTLGLPNNALGFCENSLFNVLNGRFLYGLGVVIEGNGLVVIAPEETIYEEGTEVSLTAEPAEGWLLEKWTGDATGSDTEIVITMDGDKAITASFKLERYSVAFFVSDSEGAVEGALVSFAGEERETDAQGNAEFYEISPGSKDYTITKLGYEDLAGNVIVDSDKTVDIVLACKTYELTTLVSGEGSISKSIEKERYNHGEIVELTAIPENGWSFSGWTGDLEGFLNPTQITMDNDKTVTADFVEHQYFVEVYASPENGGAVSGGGSYGFGEEALLTAEASGCYMFSGWYENGQHVSEDQEYRFDVFNDRVLEARFVASVLSKDFKFILESAFFGCKYEVRLELDPAITKVRFIYPDIDPAIQTPIPEEAVPDGNGVVDLSAFWTNRDAQVVMIVCYVGDEVVSQCEAALSKENLAEFEITFNVSDESGSVNGAVVDFNGESLQTDSQGRAVFSEAPVGNRAYTVSKTGYENSTGSVSVDSDESVNVSLAKKTYTFSTNTVGQGSVSKNPDKSTYTHGEIVQLTAIPSTGWSFSSWSGYVSGIENPVAVIVEGNGTVTATFEPLPFDITFSVKDAEGLPLQGATVLFNGQTKNTASCGCATFDGVLAGDKTYSVTKTGYHNSSGSVVVDSDKTVNVVLNVASDDGVDIDGPVYSGNRLLVSNESVSSTSRQYTGTLSSFVDLSTDVVAGLSCEAYRINPIIPFDYEGLEPLNIESQFELSAVGDTRSFWVYDFTTNRFYQITATLQAIGTECLVWSNDTVRVTQSRAQQIASEFDGVIHPLVLENFYYPSDVNNDEKVSILCFDIIDGFNGTTQNSYIAGYFYSGDLFSGTSSNMMEIFYIDTYPLMEYPMGSGVNVTRAFSTLVHEFQHMVNFNRNVFVEGDGNMDLWLNEGLSMAAEHIYGGVQTGRISFFNNSTAIRDGKSLIRWEQTLADYSLNYLFLQYIRTQMGIGSSIFKEILLDTANDYSAVENVVKKYISPSKSFGDFMTDFRLALLLKKPTGPYGFMGESCFNSVSPLFYTGTGKNLYGGGALYKSIAGSFEDPGDAGASIQYAGITLE